MSEPIVPFKETLLTVPPGFKNHLPQPWKDTIDRALSPAPSTYWYDSPTLSLLLKASPLHPEIITLFHQKTSLKTNLLSFVTKKYLQSEAQSPDVMAEFTELMAALATLGDGADTTPEGAMRRLITVGPEEADSCNIFTLSCEFSVHVWENKPVANGCSVVGADLTLHLHQLGSRGVIEQFWARIHSAVAAGFQLACSTGPLMGEPLHGVCFTVEAMHISKEILNLHEGEWELLQGIADASLTNTECNFGISVQTGQLISDLR